MGVEIRKGWFCVFVGVNITIVVALIWAMIAVPGYALTLLKVLALIAAFYAGRFTAEKLWHAACPRKESSDGVRSDRVELDRVGAVQVLGPGLEIATARRNDMGVPVHSYDNGGLIGGARLVVNDTGRPIRIFSPAQRARLREVLSPTKDDPYFVIGSPHYVEAIRILGARGRWIRRESVRQINGRYLKADQYVRDADGWLVVINDHEVLTESVRVRIPRDSWLRKDFTHSKR